MHSRHKAASTKKRPEAFWVYEETGLPHPFAELAATGRRLARWVLKCNSITQRVASRALAGRPGEDYVVLFCASVLAMVVNDNVCELDKRAALESIAGKPAPTVSR
jgi:hypothetical protein